MPDAPQSNALQAATVALRQGALLCQNVRTGLSYGVLEKGDRSPVTVADFGAQALICRTLREAFPDDAIVAEEDTSALPRNMADEIVQRVQEVRPGCSMHDVLTWIDYGAATGTPSRFWTLDPIDGTKGFLRGEQYALALALVEDSQVHLGVLACPALDGGLLFLAVRGTGAWQQDLAGSSASKPVNVSTTQQLPRARLCESVESAHSAHQDSTRLATYLGLCAPPVRLDSQAKYAIVARGEADLYLRLPTRPNYREKIWDHAAGALLLYEAGGCVTDIYGHALDFSHGATLAKNRGVVASNGVLHPRVIDAIEALGIGKTTT